MKPSEIVLNIAVNLGRISRWSLEGRRDRVSQFLAETEEYLGLLDGVKVSSRFEPTLKEFKRDLKRLKNQSMETPDWAEDTLTWANILTHRAKLA